jgi:hypothetical protein
MKLTFLTDPRLHILMVVAGIGLILWSALKDPILCIGFVLLSAGVSMLVNTRVQHWIDKNKWDRLS